MAIMSGNSYLQDKLINMIRFMVCMQKNYIESDDYEWFNDSERQWHARYSYSYGWQILWVLFYAEWNEIPSLVLKLPHVSERLRATS